MGADGVMGTFPQNRAGSGSDISQRRERVAKRSVFAGSSFGFGSKDYFDRPAVCFI